ncbi:hypothetical protein JCM33374_g2779 [Metschnikowia sp. JCM 33374]|nr:hypothetical protein JCM33374_g2779 [Metschnikowia sp. JCM 33374]
MMPRTPRILRISSIDADMENSDSSQSNLVSDRTLIDEDRPAHSPNVTARTTYAIAANEKTQKTTKTSENQKTQKTSENQNPKKITPGAGSKSSLQYEKAVRAEIERAEAEDKRNVGYLTKSIRDSLVGDDFAYARNAIDRFAQSQPIESQLMHLVDFPINTHSLKLDLINPNELSHARILEILKEWSKSRTEKCFKDCERIIDTINYATMKLEEFNSDFVEGSGDRERFDVISTLQEKQNSSRRLLALQTQELVVLSMIPKGRIIQDKIFYQASMENNTIKQILDRVDLPAGMGIGSEFINARMMETLLTNDFSSELIDTEWFSFKESLAVKGAFLIIEISHKPTPCARKKLQNQNVNAAKQKDNSSLEKNHNMYEAFNNEDEAEDAMNTEEDAPQVYKFRRHKPQSQPMDIEPNPQEGQVGAEDDGEKRKIQGTSE